MPRKGPAPKRPLVVDPVYSSPVVTQLVNRVLQDGKKTVAQRIVYDALDGVREKTQSDPSAVLKRALENVRPSLEVRSRRVGGATYQVPVEVRASRRMALAMRWLIESARKRGENSMPRKLAGELIDAAENRGGAIKKREETHRMAEANKAFAHFRW